MSHPGEHRKAAQGPPSQRPCRSAPSPGALRRRPSPRFMPAPPGPPVPTSPAPNTHCEALCWPRQDPPSTSQAPQTQGLPPAVSPADPAAVQIFAEGPAGRWREEVQARPSRRGSWGALDSRGSATDFGWAWSRVSAGQGHSEHACQHQPGNSLLLLLLFLGHPAAYGVPGRGPGPSRSCSNNKYLTRCAGPGIKLASQRSQDAADTVAPEQELLLLLF